MSSSGTPGLPAPATVPTRMAWPQDGGSRPRQLAIALGRFLRRPLALAGFLLIAGLVLLALFPEFFASANPTQIDLGRRLQPPGPDNWLGTDNFGRDIWSRVVFGARVSLLTGLAVLASAGAIGIAVGTVAGYAGGWVDEILMRLTDIFMAFPVILLAMVIVVVLKPGLTNTTIALIVVWWPAYARLMRGQTLTIKERAYVEAAIASGASPTRVIVRHILPNGMAPILVQATMDMGYVVLTAAGLGFLGLGAQEPTPEWGIMISKGRGYFLEAWWYPVFPGLAIAVTVLAFNLVGDDLRDLLDPRTR